MLSLMPFEWVRDGDIDVAITVVLQGEGICAFDQYSLFRCD